VSLLPSYRIGMIVPSSNTCLEPVTTRLLAGRDDVGIHAARLGVTRIAIDGDSDDQFDAQPMLDAAVQLADARVDLVVWNGTAGTWLGYEHDRDLCARIQEQTGIPATTSALALLEGLRALSAKRVGLAVPYTHDVADQIARGLANEGFEVTRVAALGLEENFAFATLSHDQVVQMLRDSTTPDTDAVAVVCTNVAAAEVSPRFEAEHDVPVCDSVAVTLWHALHLVGAPAELPGWGRLYDVGARSDREPVKEA
jgi:maleate isomerase